MNHLLGVAKPAAPVAACRGQGLRRRLGWLGLLACQACSPAMDWREVRPDGWHVVVPMPCRPSQAERTLELAGRSSRLGLLACVEGEHTFGLASAELDDPALVAQALKALGDAARRNVQATVVSQHPAQVSGMTPSEAATHWQFSGHLPNGTAVQAQVVVFAHGSRVFQVTVLGPTADVRFAQPLLDGLRVLP